MHLEAISIGYAVPRKVFVACVHSVFKTSVNFQAEDASGLLTLVTSDHADLPQGIRLEPSEGLYFDNLRPEQSVYCRDGLLSFQNAPLQVDLRKACRWNCDLAALDINLADPGTALAWNRVWQELNKRQIDAEAEIVAGELFYENDDAKKGAARKAGQAVRRLVQATRQYDQAAIPAAGELVGLGSGLTPSGDDLLVGYLTGLWCTFRKEIDRRRFVTSLGRAVIDFSQGTNAISRTYLLHAAHGQVTSRLVTLAQAIGQGEGYEYLLDSTEAAMYAGHTSGMDAVTGLLLGLITWNHPTIPALAI